MAHALLHPTSLPVRLPARGAASSARGRRVCSRVAFTTRSESALGEAPVSQPQVLVREHSPPVAPEDEMQQRLVEEYKRGYEAGMLAASSQSPPPPVKELVHDSVARTAAKSFTWRVLSTATTVTLAMWLFNDTIAADAAVELGVVEFLSKYGLYFVHERLWAAVTFLL